jgi:RNA polymerase sigma-70 factor (ECF subfamily)
LASVYPPVEEPPELSDPSTKDLDELLAAREGDHRAGRYLMSRHGPSMARTAWSVLGRYGGTEGEDVVQEAFIAALTTAALPTGDLGAWLRAITVRKALDSLRRSRRRKEQPLPETTDGAHEPVAGDSPERALDAMTVRRALARLSATDRAVLTLVDLEGRSMAEAAEALGLTRVAVKLRASRARRRLARWLRSERVTPPSRSSGRRGQSR